jgi:hypothetical protein
VLRVNIPAEDARQLFCKTLAGHVGSGVIGLKAIGFQCAIASEAKRCPRLGRTSGVARIVNKPLYRFPDAPAPNT